MEWFIIAFMILALVVIGIEERWKRRRRYPKHPPFGEFSQVCDGCGKDWIPTPEDIGDGLCPACLRDYKRELHGKEQAYLEHRRQELRVWDGLDPLPDNEKCDMCGVQIAAGDVLCDKCNDEVEHHLDRDAIWAPCTVCGVNQVKVSDGFDTCADCVKRS